MDYSKIELQKVHMKRHLELAVVKVENNIVSLKVTDQFYDEKEFCQQYNKSEFKANNFVTILLAEKLKWDKDNKILYIRRLHDVIKVEETIKCNVHHFADIMEAVNEYNETNGEGYEKPWPQKGDEYFYITSLLEVASGKYGDMPTFDKILFDVGNCIRTSEEAEAALERVKKALKGVDENKLLREALEEAVAMYGKPGGPWNVPGDAGGWISKARKALEVGNE